jgi:hypothetical protein
VTRILDRGAVTAAYVGIGMAVTIAISFLLVIPIFSVIPILTLLGGLLIGYYANVRSGRDAGPWPRIVTNGLFAGAVTGLSLALLLLATRALFFVADNGYRDESAGGVLRCQPGADCVYQRYLAEGQGDELAAVGVDDVDSFSGFYWSQQLASSALVLGLGSAGGIGGALLYGLFGRAGRPRDAGVATSV